MNKILSGQEYFFLEKCFITKLFSYVYDFADPPDMNGFVFINGHAKSLKGFILTMKILDAMQV